MATRKRFKTGTIYTKDNAEGRAWYLRIGMPQPDGSSKRAEFRLGSIRDLPTKRHANNAADELRRRANQASTAVTIERRVRDVVDRYMQEEMPARYGTAKGYRNLLVNHIRPFWGDIPLSAVTPESARRWLREMDCSPKSRKHRRDMLRVLFNFAMFWGWLDKPRNPIEQFRLEDATKRMKAPVVLTPEQFGRLVKHELVALEPYRSMVILAASLGLRCSELFGLQWRDVIWAEKTLLVRRAVVEGHEDRVKTVHSEKPLPLQDDLMQMLRFHLHSSDFKEPTDWIFASPFTGGALPFSAGGIQRGRLRKAGKALGISDRVGWHTLRHSYRAWLGKTKAEIGVQQALMRHADVATTMNVYGAAFVEELRVANDSVVRSLIQ